MTEMTEKWQMELLVARETMDMRKFTREVSYSFPG